MSKIHFMNKIDIVEILKCHLMGYFLMSFLPSLHIGMLLKQGGS